MRQAVRSTPVFPLSLAALAAAATAARTLITRWSAGLSLAAQESALLLAWCMGFMMDATHAPRREWASQNSSSAAWEAGEG